MSVLTLKIVEQPSGKILELDEITRTGAESLIGDARQMLSDLEKKYHEDMGE